jgi:hypothetical protein
MKCIGSCRRFGGWISDFRFSQIEHYITGENLLQASPFSFQLLRQQLISKEITLRFRVSANLSSNGLSSEPFSTTVQLDEGSHYRRYFS